MQGVLCDIKRFAVHDGPGIRTTVFFKGCPLRCAWCHNPESISAKPEQFTKKTIFQGKIIKDDDIVGRSCDVEELMGVIGRERSFMESSEGGVTFSGGEPLFQIDFLETILKRCKEEGYHTAVDTCGEVPWGRFERILPYTDLFLFDLKHKNRKKHKHFTKVTNDRILENLNRIMASGARIRLRIPIVPGFNHSLADQVEMITYIQELKGTIESIDLLPYHAIANHKYERLGMINRMSGVKTVHADALLEYKKLYSDAGYLVSIGG